MAEEEETEETESEAPAKPLEKPSLLRYLPLVLVIIALQAAGAYYLIEFVVFAPPETTSEVQDEIGRPRTIPDGDEPEASVNLGEFFANPRGTRARLLVRAVITLGVAPSGARLEIESPDNEDPIKDAIVRALGNATYEMLRSPRGRQKVKLEIKDRLNQILYRGQVQEVYFGEFYLQAMPGFSGG